VSEGLEEDEVPWTLHLRRKEQDLVDSVIQGNETGHYFVLLGPKVCLYLSISGLALTFLERVLERHP
jgi:hypothetical protein